MESAERVHHKVKKIKLKKSSSDLDTAVCELVNNDDSSLLQGIIQNHALDALTLKQYRHILEWSEGRDFSTLFGDLTQVLLQSNNPRHKALVSYSFIHHTLDTLSIDAKLKKKILKHWEKAEVPEVLGLLAVLNIIDDPKFEIKTLKPAANSRDALLEQYFKGGLFAIEDGGELYRQLIQPTGSADRSYDCSHPSTNPVHSYQGQFIPEFLFGTRDIQLNDNTQVYTPSSTKAAEKGQGRYTWWQTEYASLKGRNWLDSVLQWFKHKISFLIYKITKKNVGPFGQSEFMEKNILMFSRKPVEVAAEIQAPTDYFKPRTLQ